PPLPPLRKAVRSGSSCGRRWSSLLLTCLLENSVGRSMVPKYARLYLLVSATARAGCFPPAIAPCASQSFPQPLAQLRRRSHVTQQQEQRIHFDQLADCHHLTL